MKKYLIVPDYVISKSDGDRHFIGASQLMELYRVTPEECVVYDDRWADVYFPKDLIVLSPRYDGNYELPEVMNR